MNYDELVNSLRICSSIDSAACAGCLYHDHPEVACDNKLMTDAADAIKALQAYCEQWKETDPTKRPSWCPIICSLPEGHGPLVDFNDVSKELRKYGYVVEDETTGMKYMEYPIVLEQNPILIPTIVPAEAERSET